MSTRIPTPPSVPFLGHINTLDKEVPIRSIRLLAQQYGEIFQLNILGEKILFVSSYDLLNEISDDKRFRKNINANLMQVRNAVKDGLFTADIPGEEENWGIAHRLLAPCFSPASVLGMFDGMMDIISQLLLKWERFGPYEDIDPAADYTRLTLDAISLCSMTFRPNSFYREKPHPFATAMSEFLAESGLRAARPSIMQAMMSASNAKYEENIRIMDKLATEILEDHRNHPPKKPDLVSIMMNGRDKETGKGLSDDNVKRNLLTFLIAGHETTSGLLTFTTYFLLKNPEAMRKLREEIDTKIGDRPVSSRDVNQLPYLLAVMRESLRLGPPPPLRRVAPTEDTVIGGKYKVEKDVAINCSIYSIHRDPKVWGDDAEEFRPERMLDGKFEALPPNAWQPFGYGIRACIGRPFAWQEAQLALISILQRFDLVMRDPTYELELKQTLTIKPRNLYIRVIPRSDRPRLLLVPGTALATTAEVAQDEAGPASAVAVEEMKPLHVFYGSNTGTSESFAQRIVSVAPAHGFRAAMETLDMATEHLPTDGPVLIITASFEGQPADNARRFVDWLEHGATGTLAGVAFSVFGCGNRDWVQTYQRIPRLVDRVLGERGAKRLVEHGEGDAASPDFFADFDEWEKRVWEKLAEEYGTGEKKEAASITVKTVSSGTSRAERLRQRDMGFGTVVESKVLTAPGAPVKKHIEVSLPEGSTYRAGDYLAVLPTNPERVVRRAVGRFGLSEEQEIEIDSTAPTSLPTGKPITVYNLLSGYVELQQPATMRDLDILLAAKNSETSTAALQALKSNYADKVFAPRLSILDILEENRDIDLPLSTFLQMLPSMRIRQYSISSSPLWNPQHATLTISVVDAPARSGRAEPFLGVASTYLAGLRPGDKVQLAVRPSNAAFHPPSDPTVPMVIICAGSGLAPMRGFLQERAEQKKAGRDVAQSLLFFGCRAPGEDDLYADGEMKEWRELGIVDVRPAFSRQTEASLGCRYVQDRIAHDKDDVVNAIKGGAKVFVCGSSKVATGAKQAIVNFIKEIRRVDDAEALKVFGEVLQDRYATDIFE